MWSVRVQHVSEVSRDETGPCRFEAEGRKRRAPSRVPRHKEKVYWDCDADLQGISVGYGDPYHHALEGQEIDITDLAEGTCYLTFDADPSQHWLETDDNNNRSWVKFRLQRKGANASVTVLEEFG
jgi:hypothetical protein